MINITFINKSNISFKKIPIKKIDNVNLSPEYKFATKDCNDYFVRSDFNSSENEIFTSIDTDKDKDVDINTDIANNKSGIDLSNNTLYANSMYVFNTSDRHQGFGVVLHLNNVINMLENNLDNIKLFSLGTAVLFHSKFKFEPDIKNSQTLKETLKEIRNKDFTKFPEIKNVTQKANDFVLKTEFKRNRIIDYDKFIQEGNEIVQEYLDIVSSKKLNDIERNKYGFCEGMHMVLTKEKILENKDFYNKLFKKYNIDYEIKDPQ